MARAAVPGQRRWLVEQSTNQWNARSAGYAPSAHPGLHEQTGRTTITNAPTALTA